MVKIQKISEIEPCLCFTVDKKNGFLIAVMVTVANVHDSKAAYLLMRVLKELCSGIKVILADGGCRGELIGNIKNKLVMEFKWLLVHAYKEQGFKPIHKRWIVEKIILVDGQ